MFNKLTPTLVRAIGVFSVTLMVSMLVVFASYFYMDDAQQEQLSAKRAMLVWQAKINNSVENNQIIDEFESNFLKLVNQGVVGEEDRLSWFETIQNTAKSRGMPLVKYSISSQQALTEDNLKSKYNGIDVYKSMMTLDITMAHEGDLFALLNDLEKADGLFTVDLCHIEKNGYKRVNTDNNMKARCELGWYTFRGSNSSKGKNNAS